MRLGYPGRTDRLNWWPLTRPLAEAQLVYETRVMRAAEPGRVSPPRPSTNWADWSDVMGREMYLRRALDRLNFE
jgi:hypothetical protein